MEDFSFKSGRTMSVAKLRKSFVTKVVTRGLNQRVYALPGLWMVEHQLVVFSQHNKHVIENFWQVKY